MTQAALKPLADQVLLITGATSGIGLVTAKAAAARGAKVVLVARNEPALREAVSDIVTAGGVADFAVADVADLGQVEAAADKAVARFGRIDTWVSNAGVTIYATLLETPEDEHQRLMQTNYFGAVHGALTAVRHLRERGGALITVASIAADIPSPIMGAYSASKHAVKGYIESLRIELNAAQLPISVTLIKPAGISTPIAQHAPNHMDGEAMLPPPVYDPALVADAILHAAEHRRRDITVGGIGKLQVLASEHFPGLLARFGGAMMPLLVDRTTPPTRTDNLEQAGEDGEMRSARQPGRKTSVYSAAALNPGAVVLGAAVVAGGLAWLGMRRRDG